MTSFPTSQLSFTLKDDSFDLETPSSSWLGARLKIVTSTGETRVGGLKLDSQQGDPDEGYEIRLSGASDLGQVRLRIGLDPAEPVAFIWVELSAASALTLRYVTLSGQPLGDFDRAWMQGWQSWSPAYVTPLDQPDEAARDALLDKFGEPAKGRASFDVGLLGGPASSLCAGFLAADRFLGCVTFGEQSFECSWLAGELAVEAGEVVSLEALRIDLGDPAEALPRYGEAVAQAAATSHAQVAPAGWCSWYYYYTGVTESDVLANLHFLEQHRREIPVGYVQLDDGYQAHIGDWRDWNEKFPAGPKGITRKVHDAGLKAGLWLAPFLAGENSELARNHPDWLVADEEGRPLVALRNWDQANYALDLTNQQVSDWLRELFEEIFDDWEFDYVKVDFVYAAALPGLRKNRRRTPVEAYREGLAIIRRAAGERFVLGCGALQLASVGLVDGMRIGPDVAPWWRARGPRGADGERHSLARLNAAPAAEAAIRNTLQRSWTHARLWPNDPDCVLVRDSQTRLTPAEMQSLATVIGLSAGMTVLSDNLTELSEDAVRNLSFILPPLPYPAAVRGVLDSELPDRLELDAGERLVVALFNWTDAERDLALRVTEAEVFDVWQERYLGVVRGELVLPGVAAHGCRLLSLTPADARPRVLATSFHIGQGLYEIDSEVYDPSSEALTIRLNAMPRRRGSLWIRWPLVEPDVVGDYESARLEAGVVRLDLVVDKVSELILRSKQP